MVTWGWCEASSGKPLGYTLSRRSLVACACWSIVASGRSRMSMAVTASGVAGACARAFAPGSAKEQASVAFITKLVRFFMSGLVGVELFLEGKDSLPVVLHAD